MRKEFARSCRTGLYFGFCVIAAAEICCAANGTPRPLFNGKDLSGWHADVPEKDQNPQAKDSFVVRDGMLVSLGTPGGHLITDDEFENYRLEIEYRFAGEPGNCGVLVHASKPRALYEMFPQSLEVQMQSGEAGDFWCIVEDIEVPEMETRRGPKEKWGITEGKERRNSQPHRWVGEAAGRVEQNGDRVCWR